MYCNLAPSSCDGHYYRVDCYNTSCDCAVDGNVVSSVTVAHISTACVDAAASDCGFPSTSTSSSSTSSTTTATGSTGRTCYQSGYAGVGFEFLCCSFTEDAAGYCLPEMPNSTGSTTGTSGTTTTTATAASTASTATSTSTGTGTTSTGTGTTGSTTGGCYPTNFANPTHDPAFCCSGRQDASFICL